MAFTTRPFALAVKEYNPDVKIATTSTYNYLAQWGFGYNNTLQGTITEWLQGYSSQSAKLIDYINLHNYPHNNIAGTVAGVGRSRSLNSIQEWFEDVGLPEIFEIADRYDVGVIITESNSADRVTPGTAAEKGRISMAEGLYFAETFMLSAKFDLASLTPFAVHKTVFPNGGDSDGSNPTQTGFLILDMPVFDVHFYPNNTLNSWGYGN